MKSVSELQEDHPQSGCEINDWNNYNNQHLSFSLLRFENTLIPFIPTPRTRFRRREQEADENHLRSFGSDKREGLCAYVNDNVLNSNPDPSNRPSVPSLPSLHPKPPSDLNNSLSSKTYRRNIIAKL